MRGWMDVMSGFGREHDPGDQMHDGAEARVTYGLSLELHLSSSLASLCMTPLGAMHMW